MPHKKLLILGLLLVLLAPWHAHAMPAAADIRSNLAIAGDIAVDNYILLKDDLNGFYAARNYDPAWNFAGPDNNAAFASFVASVEQLIDYHGLRREDYALDKMRQLAADTGEGSALQLELLTTDTLLRLAHSLHGDNHELNILYVGWDFLRDPVDIPALLAAAVASNGLNEFIDGVSPHMPTYAQLARALRAYRDIAANGGWQPVSSGPILRPGANDPRVTQICARLEAENYLSKRTCDGHYDEALGRAVKLYQLHNGLHDDGNTGPLTVAVMNVPVQDRIEQIRANIERWRHMPDDFPPERYVTVNIADASIDIVENKKSIYRGEVIVGRVDRKTPFIDSEIRSMIINPSWHVPVKIAKKDILPKLRKDPHYLEKLGFVISGNTKDPHGNKIDWESMPAQEFNFRLRQSPGDLNSLGRLKFDFDNDFAVYMHGTPHQELFNKSERTFSSGCIRLRDPEQVGEILLTGTEGNWTIEKIDAQIAAAKTRWVGVTNPMPLYVLYWTAFVDEAGDVNFRKDVYGYDAMLSPHAKDMLLPPDDNPAPQP